MATQSIHAQTIGTLPIAKKANLTERFNAFADKQAKNAAVWWLASLMVIGTLFLPLTFLLVATLDGPTLPYLGLSMISFFACVVSNMSGMGIKANLFTFFFSLILHLVMILSVLI